MALLSSSLLVSSSPSPRSSNAYKTPTANLFSYKSCHLTITTAATTVTATPTDTDTATTSTDEGNEKKTTRSFTYSKASPSVRWPHLKLANTTSPPNTISTLLQTHMDAVVDEDNSGPGTKQEDDQIMGSDKGGDKLGRRSRTRMKKMTKLALKRAKDWRERVKFYTDRILALKHDEFVADVLDDRSVQMTPTDFCFVVKWVGQESWHRGLEVYEWLNLRHWYSPNPRMLATILAVLGKANQESLAVEIFTRAEPTVGNTVQVYNAMMGVYARNGRFEDVQELFDIMRVRGCEPDLVSFNTLINARLKVTAGARVPDLAIQLLNEVRSSKLRPDVITYNTLISACSRESNLEGATKVYDDMKKHKCQPDLWTYNAMVSVYGRCGLSSEAENIFNELESKGFLPDAVTYNSLLFAFARDGNIVKVKEICDQMVKVGFGKDEMTYNTIIHMYGKKGRLDLALELYKDMKSSGRIPDVVTYTVLIDSLGKANRITEAADIMSEMLDAGVKPTVRTYSALIFGYAKVGKPMEAEETYNCMIRSGIRPDRTGFSIMLDIYLRFNEGKKAMMIYNEMTLRRLTPDRPLYEVMLRVLKENEMEIDKVVKDMEELCGMTPQTISSILVKGQCYEHAALMLQSAIANGHQLEPENLISIVDSYSSAGRHEDACKLLKFVKEHNSGSSPLIIEALVEMLCKAGQIDAALEEYYNICGVRVPRSCTMYESLIQCCEKNNLIAEASQVFSDMIFSGTELTEQVYQLMVLVYCKMGFPETADNLIHQAETAGILLNNFSIYVSLIEAYGKLKLLEKAESIVGNARQKYPTLDRKIWNALIQAYAANGCYEKARAVLNTMMRDGPSPTVDTINGLLQALIVDGRLNELYVAIQELQDMGFKISKSSILLMLEAFAQNGNIFEVKKIYHGMKAAGYFPTMHLYRVMIGLLCRGKRVRDVEAMVAEMEEAGFKPDISIRNSMLKLYTGIEDFRKTTLVYQQIQDANIEPDEETYNTLIIMYCRNRKAEEGLSLMHEMRRHGLDPKLDTYKSLISALGKQQQVVQAEEIFEELRSSIHKLDRSFYHTMMKIFRDSGNHSKAENLLNTMKDAGIEPTIATMHLLMLSYGGAQQPQEAENVLTNLKVAGSDLSTLPYSTVIDAYLKNKNYDIGIQKLMEMREDGMEPDHRIWTCFINAASLCQQTSEAISLLTALQDNGFDLPIRLLKQKSESLVSVVDCCLEKLQPLEDNAAFNFVNALENLLWAFERRATASWVFQLAIRRNIYRHNLFRVSDKDWGADFRKLSGGAALVGLTLWLDQMQDASLQGYPQSPKSVVLITGTAEYNMVSLNKTIKACLWEMGSPFLPCKTRSGLLVAKAHSLRMWLKDSPFCLDLELKDSLSLSELNSMQLMEGCFIRCGLVPAFKDITDRLGSFVRPKKFARLALLPDKRREIVIQADIEGRKEKLEKVKKNGNRKIKIPRRRKYVRKQHVGRTSEK